MQRETRCEAKIAATCKLVQCKVQGKGSSVICSERGMDINELTPRF
jgi:hypothetical protein